MTIPRPLDNVQDQQNWWWGPQSVSYEGQLFFLLISRRVEAGSDRGFFNFWLWMAGSEARAGAFRSVGAYEWLISLNVPMCQPQPPEVGD